MKNWKTILFIATCFITLIQLSYATDIQTKADRPVIKVDDTWTYTKTVGTNKNIFTYKVVNIEPDGGYQVDVQKSTGGKTRIEKYDPNGNLIADGKEVFAPSRDVLRFPLEVGKSYIGSKFSKKNLKEPQLDITAKAEIKSITLDKIEVKAGSFNVFKVEVEIPYDGKGRNGNNVSNIITETYWYSSEVGLWVKRHSNDRGHPGLVAWELESFKRAE